MRCPVLPMLLFLAFTLSCSESPPVQQAGPTQSIEPLVEIVVKPLDKRLSRLAIGDTAPNFQLQDQEGAKRTLESLLAQGKVAVVFHRSADW